MKHSVSAFISYLDVLSKFLRSLLNPDPVLSSACNPSQSDVIWKRYKHTSIFQIMTENIASFAPESDLADTSHVTAALGSLERWKRKYFSSFILHEDT